jgi:predicted 2-oxoglutarate/Fe(II)-dependent dioxygenase YbiX
MSSIAVEFAKALSTVSRPGAFFVAGTEQMLAPGLTVEGVGAVALPLLPAQAEHLIAAAERAPYGRGEDTLTDISVRRTWQIDAGRVRINGKHWPQTIRTIVARVTEGLGVADPIEAELYKLLVYDQGSFFVPHRDTEKVPGMFATLVLALPSVSEGGTLIVRHKEREARLDLRCEEPSDVAFAAFYADCVHEVLPVTAGYRLVLVYNLLRCRSGRLPKAPNYDKEQEAIRTLLKQWVKAPRSPADGEPEKLIYPLEHAYTPAELGFGSLKGADAGIAEVVVAATRHSGCDVHLALITIEERGSAEYTGDYYHSRRHRYRDDDEHADEFRVVEVTDRRAVASAWRPPDGEPSPLTEIPVMEDEFSPPVSFEKLEPDEEHFHEATGNEGASFERTYSRAALILWPSDRLLAVINQAGRGVTLPFLVDLADRWTAKGSDRDSPLWHQARALSEHMVSTWRMDRWYPHRDKKGVVQTRVTRRGGLTRPERMMAP